jgi:hypothetical protein
MSSSVQVKWLDSERIISNFFINLFGFYEELLGLDSLASWMSSNMIE